MKHTRAHEESGFTLVFTALTVTVIMLFVAMSVDLGAGFAERREDQSAADGAALAASHEVGDAAKRDAAIRYAERTLSTTSATTGLASAALNWNSCAGETPDDPDVTVSAPNANCVRFDSTRSKTWVRIPSQTVAFFSPAAGMDPVTHSAAAIAQRNIEGLGGILPFGISDGATGHQCMRSDSGGNADFCDGPSVGNFGEADFSIFDTPHNCANSSGDDNRMQFNVSQGVDHELAIRGADIRRVDQNVCTNTTPGPANAVIKATGLTQQKFGDAIAHGFTLSSVTYQGRLAQKLSGWWGSSERETVNGTDLDSVALWDHIGVETDGPFASKVPESCRRSMFIDTSGPDGSILTGDGSNATGTHPEVINYIQTTYPPTNERGRILLERCFTHFAGDDWDDNGSGNWSGWNASIFGLTLFISTGGAEPRTGCTDVALGAECSTAVFTRADDASDFGVKIDMQLTSRFGYTPVLSGAAWAGSTPRDIIRFRAVYIYRLCGDGCTGTGSNIYRFDPGTPTDGNSTSDKAGDLTAFVFPDNMLPEGLASAAAPFGVDRQATVELIR